MVLDELVTYLGAQGIGTPGVDLFYGSMKEGYPSAITLIIAYGGLIDEPSLGDSGKNGTTTRLEYPRVQVICRGVRADTDGPFIKALAARAALMKINNTVIGTARYLAVEPLQPPFRLKSDENFRELYVFNCHITKTLS